MSLFSRKRLRDQFSNGDSLRLFTEAVEYFQAYQKEPDSQQIEDAVQKLETCRDRYPNDLLPLYYLGLVRVEQGYTGVPEAIKIFERILSDVKDKSLELDATYNLGIANIELYDDKATIRARKLLNNAVSMAKQVDAVQARAAGLHSKVLLLYMDADALENLRWDELLEVAKVEKRLEELAKELSDGDLPEVPKNYIHAEYWNVKGIVARYRSISAYEGSERIARRNQAKEAYEKALQYKRNWIPSLSNLATLYQDQFEKPKKALELWQEVLRIRPDDQYAHYNLGKFHHDTDPKKARRHYEKAPSIPEARRALARLPEDGEGYGFGW
jgi:tetratricopeptide (TPR) repeat protein